MQVEVLFSGTANAMRRQCLVPIADFLQRQGPAPDARSSMSPAEPAASLRFVKQAFPRLAVTGSDLSAAYLEEARRHLKPYRDGRLVKPRKAEALPLPMQSFDIVTSIYLFHEVPPKIRRDIAREFARVLKPGGLLVFMDSLQTRRHAGLRRHARVVPGKFPRALLSELSEGRPAACSRRKGS